MTPVQVQTKIQVADRIAPYILSGGGGGGDFPNLFLSWFPKWKWQ